MTLFLIASVVLMVLAVLIVCRPLFRQHANSPADAVAQNDITLAILRDQQVELEQERAQGALSEEAYATAHAELQRRLLEEVATAEKPAANSDRLASSSNRAKHTAMLLIILIPMISVLGYALLGNPAALNPELTAPQQQMTPEKIAAMVDRLAQRMKENPEDMEGWLRLAQAYKVMGRYEEAAAAYAKAEKEVNKNAGLLAAYAEAIAMSSPSGLKGKPAKLVARALQLEPENPHALLLAGAIAMENNNPKMAVSIWEKLLPMVEPGSEVEQMLKASIERIRAEHKLPAGK